MEQAKKNPGRRYLVGGHKAQVNMLEKLHKLKAYSIDVSIEIWNITILTNLKISVGSNEIMHDAVVFVGTPTIQTRALLVSGNPEHLVILLY